MVTGVVRMVASKRKYTARSGLNCAGLSARSLCSIIYAGFDHALILITWLLLPERSIRFAELRSYLRTAAASHSFNQEPLPFSQRWDWIRLAIAAHIEGQQDPTWCKKQTSLRDVVKVCIALLLDRELETPDTLYRDAIDDLAWDDYHTGYSMNSIGPVYSWTSLYLCRGWRFAVSDDSSE